MSEWQAQGQRENASFLVEDLAIRKLVEAYYHRAGIAKIVIRKTAKEGEILIFASKLGAIMGKDGAKIKALEDKIKAKFNRDFKVTIKSVKNPELSAKIMAEHIADQLEGRMPFRRVGKQVVKQIMDRGAEGVKIKLGGRLGGVDMARTETFKEGRIPLQTLRADIDYEHVQANTKYGAIGVKVWIAK